MDRNLIITDVCGDRAGAIVRRGAAEAIAPALEGFAAIIGSEVRSHFSGGKLRAWSAWSEDPFRRSAHSHTLPGHAMARANRRVLSPMSCFSPERRSADFGGAMTVGGACLAGRDAAQAVFGLKNTPPACSSNRLS